jgi:heme exporter protein D
MAFDSFADFLAMGRHGVYVWSAYGVSFAIVFWNIAQPLWRRRQLLRDQAAALRRAARDDEE